MLTMIIVMIVMKVFLDRLFRNIHPPQDTISFSRLNMNDTFHIPTSANRVNDINDSICFKNKEAPPIPDKKSEKALEFSRQLPQFVIIIWLNLDRSRWGLPVDEMEMKF